MKFPNPFELFEKSIIENAENMKMMSQIMI